MIAQRKLRKGDVIELDFTNNIPGRVVQAVYINESVNEFTDRGLIHYYDLDECRTSYCDILFLKGVVKSSETVFGVLGNQRNKGDECETGFISET